MIDFQKLPSPCFVLDEQLLDRNLAVIDRVRRESGAEVIVALKACAMWSIFPELAQHSDGATASSLAEAFERFGQMALLRGISCGLRINPGYSPVETDLYNPCVPGSRLGIPAGELKELPAVEGLHFHVLCESRPEHLRLALDAVEERFGRFLDRIKWLNMGGGHLMTHKDYDCDELILGARDPEPGEKGWRMGGNSCLAGDYYGDWIFDRDLRVGDRIVFEDMIHYTMVKTTMFNGVAHPAIAIVRRDGAIEIIREFGYEDFKSRMS